MIMPPVMYKTGTARVEPEQVRRDNRSRVLKPGNLLPALRNGAYDRRLIG